MRYPQIVVYESNGWLAAQVAELAATNAWLLRESRQPEAALNLLLTNRTSVLLLKCETRFEDEFKLLAAVHRQVPSCRVIVVFDSKGEGGKYASTMAGLAYDLGAAFVLFPPLNRSTIEDLVVGLMGVSTEPTTEETECANSPF